MQTDSVEKAAGVGAIGLWAAMHGWLGWLVVLYAACMMLDCLTGTAQAIKNGEWSSHKARQGLWHKGGSIIMVFVSVLTDILLGLTLNHISGLTLPFNYDMLLTPIVLFWYIVSELGSILENAEKIPHYGGVLADIGITSCNGVICKDCILADNCIFTGDGIR